MRAKKNFKAKAPKAVKNKLKTKRAPSLRTPIRKRPELVHAGIDLGAQEPTTAAEIMKNRQGPRMTGPKSGDSDRGLYVRFESPAIKAQVKAAAYVAELSMNAYIVRATLKEAGIASENSSGKESNAAEDAREAVPA